MFLLREFFYELVEMAFEGETPNIFIGGHCFCLESVCLKCTCWTSWVNSLSFNLRAWKKCFFLFCFVFLLIFICQIFLSGSIIYLLLNWRSVGEKKTIMGFTIQSVYMDRCYEILCLTFFASDFQQLSILYVDIYYHVILLSSFVTYPLRTSASSALGLLVFKELLEH